MNLIKRSCLLTVLCLLLTACGADSPTAPADPPESPPEEIAGEPVSGVIFTYNGKDYDLQERNPMVNALMAETPVGGTIVVEGHIVPNVAYYGIFDTETETFIKDIEGANLTWRDDDISTAAYSLWSEIYDYDGGLLKKLDLSDSEYISGLTWKDSQHLTVEISSINSESPEALEITVGEEPALAFPPTEETVWAAAEKLDWVLNPKETQSWAEDQIFYALEREDQTRASISCAVAEGNRVLMEGCAVTLLPDKPQFAWEDWQEAVALAETLYGGFSEGELYQTLSGQEIPEPDIPPEGTDTPTGQESLSWEAELPAGYGRVQWSISAGTVEHNFPSPVIQDWRVTFTVSLYESREAYESISA
mgnify:FL=1